MSGWHVENAASLNADLDRIHAAEEADIERMEADEAIGFGTDGSLCTSAECGDCGRVELKTDMVREGSLWLCLVCESKRWEQAS